MSTDDERIARLERQVEVLLAKVEQQAARIAALETENAELRRRVGENSSNSNKPPSSDSPADRAARPKDDPSGRRRGGQRGHKGHTRTFLPAAQVRSTTHCFPDACRRCGDALPRRRDPDPVRHQVVDIPTIEPVADDYWLHRVTCTCGETTCGTIPVGVPQGMLGTQVLALIAVMTADGHMSRRKVQGLLSAVFGLDVSLGTISESEQVVSDAVAPAVDEARLHALTEKVKHLDATSWRESGSYRALWTLATATVTVFTILGDGSREALRTWIDRVRGVLVTDRGTQFDFWALERRQICWAHLIRKFANFGELKGRPGAIGRDLLLWSRVLLHSWHRVRDGTGTRAELRSVATNVRALMERLLEEGAALPVKGFKGACRNILDHRDALWRFVTDTGVEPTNNHAERELRGLVCWRRCSGGSQSQRGNEFATNLKSVIHTCRKQHRDVLGYLNSAIHAALHDRKAPSLIAAA
ncbi:MAG TPA: IS66 family transposase [Kofleriaceae bacterium]|nr:IS66 family transposase [Kofleriaceae bacterium]